MTKVRQDKHGLYVKTDGSIFRPLFPAEYAHVYKNKTTAQAGDEVAARHIRCTELASIKIKDTKEMWFYHGSYLNKKSEDVYEPNHHRWK